jgi:hypothetical protein
MEFGVRAQDIVTDMMRLVRINNDVLEVREEAEKNIENSKIKTKNKTNVLLELENR